MLFRGSTHTRPNAHALQFCSFIMMVQCTQCASFRVSMLSERVTGPPAAKSTPHTKTYLSTLPTYCATRSYAGPDGNLGEHAWEKVHKGAWMGTHATDQRRTAPSLTGSGGRGSCRSSTGVVHRETVSESHQLGAWQEWMYLLVLLVGHLSQGHERHFRRSAADRRGLTGLPSEAHRCDASHTQTKFGRQLRSHPSRASTHLGAWKGRSPDGATDFEARCVIRRLGCAQGTWSQIGLVYATLARAAQGWQAPRNVVLVRRPVPQSHRLQPD